MDIQNLIKHAVNVRENAYAPYSGFKVGAAVLTRGNKIYTGCNIENASYSLSVCAERSALFTAISGGERQFCAMAVVGGNKEALVPDFCYPCGSCLQVISEFVDGDTFKVILSKGMDEYKIFLFRELLPMRFSI